MSFSKVADFLPDPVNYFKGRSKVWSCEVDHVLLFLRKSRENLQRKTFASNPHHRFVLLVNLKTPGVVNVDGRYLYLKPDHATVIFPYQFHHYLQIPEKEIRWLFITFESSSPSAFEDFRGQTLALNEEARERIASLLRIWKEEASPFTHNLLAGELQCLLITLRQCLAKEHAGASMISALSRKQMHLQILSAVNACVSRPSPGRCSISDVARGLKMSESHLRGLFRKNFGLSLGTYLRNYQIHQALAHMQNSSAALYEIADACGYTSLATFSRAFKAHTGLSPYAFRKKYFR